MKLRVLLLAGSVLLLVLASLLLPAAAAAQGPKRLAVLELRGVFEREELSVLSDQLRQGALAALKGTAYTVMTRENMAVLARNMGIDLAECQEGAECEVDIGRNVGADLVMSGAVVRFGSKLTVTIKVHDTNTGTLLSSKGVRAANEDELYELLPPAATALLREGLGLGRRSGSRSSAPSTAQEGAIGEESSSFSLGSAVQEEVVRFESTPPGAVVLLDGDLLCSATPCRKRIEAGSYRVSMQMERYHPSTKDIDVKSGMSAVAVSLKPKFARLTVTTKPPGLAILLNGKKVGEAGLQGRELDPGAHELIVDERCYLRSGERVVLEEGQDRTVELVAKQRKAGLRVDVEDSAGNILDGRVWVDGKDLGDAPGPFELRLCSQKLEVRSAGAGTWSSALELQDNQVTKLQVVLGALPATALEALERDLRQGMAADEATVVGLYRESCDGGYQVACRWLQERDGQRPTLKRAGEFFAPYCDGGDPLACLVAGWSLTQKHAGTPSKEGPDPKRGASLISGACQQGYLRACVEFGRLHGSGVGVGKDESKVVQLFRKACDGGNMWGCANLGYMYVNGTGVAKDDRKAVQLFREACDGGNMRGCGILGYMYVNGTGVAKDESKAVQLYRKACDGGDMWGCKQL